MTATAMGAREGGQQETAARTAPPAPATPDRYRIVNRWDGFVALKCVYRDGRYWRCMGEQEVFATYGAAVAWVRERQAIADAADRREGAGA